MYGGAAAGGKSDALLMAALQFVDVPGYSALILRRSFTDLALPGALMDRAAAWLANTPARPIGGGKSWEFPSGATLNFGYLDTESDKFRYQSAEFQFIAFDEATQFLESQYTYLFSRLRKLKDSDIPLRMRAASNPGGVGHDWVKRRFLIESDPDPDSSRSGNERVFVPAVLDDNPSVDREEYLRSLNQLDPVTRRQLLMGDWDAYEGGRFAREWFPRYRAAGDRYWMRPGAASVPAGDLLRFVIVDPAATARESSDYTVIGVFGLTPGNDLLVLDIVRDRLPIDKIVPAIERVCRQWGPEWVGIEETGFQLAIVNEARRNTKLPPVQGLAPAGRGKLERATPAIIKAESGQVWLPDQAEWLADFLAELSQFTGDPRLDSHDDQVDVLAYAVQALDHLDLLGGTALPVTLGRYSR